MKLWQICTTTLKEQIRSGWDLILSLSLAPVFILIYWIFMGSGAALTVSVLVVNNDRVDGVVQVCSQEVINRLADLKHTDGTPVLRVKELDDTAAAEQKIKDRQAVAAIIFPPGYTQEIQRVRNEGGTMSAEASALVIGWDKSRPPGRPVVGGFTSSVAPKTSSALEPAAFGNAWIKFLPPVAAPDVNCW